ncbi:hypothetical protein SLUN_30830 [Streptomyces lunaelactis]|uniref:Uncharacterized protein n=1 Tax=Streptomyces lunaelactis TaxID=1535768 RepID=A0A2R4TA20_9ACTN|nr:hypothetical protein SLUN_30830 [Streptomyces lunaelactis]
MLQRLLGISPMAAERWSAGAVRTAYFTGERPTSAAGGACRIAVNDNSARTLLTIQPESRSSRCTSAVRPTSDSHPSPLSVEAHARPHHSRGGMQK